MESIGEEEEDEKKSNMCRRVKCVGLQRKSFYRLFWVKECPRPSSFVKEGTGGKFMDNLEYTYFESFNETYFEQ